MYLFDTYAIIEIIKGNKKYFGYTDKKIIINKFILSELAYWLIRNHSYETASIYLSKYEYYLKDVDIETIKKAMLFRHKYKKQKLSMVDCISYMQAQSLGIKFLTGDKEFEKFKDVEFVKK